MLLLSELLHAAGPVSSLAARSYLLYYGSKGDCIFTSCLGVLLEDPREGEASTLTPSFSI